MIPCSRFEVSSPIGADVQFVVSSAIKLSLSYDISLPLGVTSNFVVSAPYTEPTVFDVVSPISKPVAFNIMSPIYQPLLFDVASPISIPIVLNLDATINKGCVMTNPAIYDHTVGAQLELHVAETLTNVDSITLAVRKPLNVRTEWTADSYTTDGELVIYYSTKAGDIDVPGVYHLQPIVSLKDGSSWPLGVVCWTIYAQTEDVK